MYLYVYYNETGMKSEISDVMWHVAPESKIQLVNCKLSPYFSLERSSVLVIRSIDVYILWSLLFSPLSHARLTFLLKRAFLRCFSLSLGGFENVAIR